MAESTAEAAARVTTVIATQNRWSDLVETIPRHDGPVILVDNGSTDGTAERVREAFPHVLVIPLPHNIGAVARNVGVGAATTPYVAFADDDSWWAPGSLDRAADLFDAHPRLALLAGRILVGPEESVDPVCELMARSPLPGGADLPGPSVLGFVACGAIVRREAYLEAGGFDPVVEFFGEETRLALDLSSRGWGLAYCDAVVAHHHPSTNRPPGTSRRALGSRNAVLTAVMRRPWPGVREVVARELRTGRPGVLGVARSLSRLRSALRERRVVPDRIERELQLLTTDG